MEKGTRGDMSVAVKRQEREWTSGGARLDTAVWRDRTEFTKLKRGGRFVKAKEL